MKKRFLACLLLAAIFFSIIGACLPIQPARAESVTTVPLYHWWNGEVLDHFYTTDPSGEIAESSGYVFQGVQGDVAPVQVTGTTPLYRFYHPAIRDHFYTTNPAEIEVAKGYGYIDEGIACYVSTSQMEGTTPLYRWYSSQWKHHFYTTDSNEPCVASDVYSCPSWTLEGIEGYVWKKSTALISEPESIDAFTWAGQDADKVGKWGNGSPDGVMDGHFLLSLNLPVKTEIASIAVYSAGNDGEPAGGQVWHSKDSHWWILGVFNNGRQLNRTHVDKLGKFSGKVQFDLYANDSGWFKEGNPFLVEVEFRNGTKLQALTAVGRQIPANLQAYPGNNEVYLTWDGLSDTTSLVGYYLYRGTTPGGQSSTPVTDFPVKDTAFIDKNVENGITYYYVVRAVFDSGEIGEASNEVSVKPGIVEQPKETIIVLQIENPYMIVNGETLEIDPGRGTAPVIVNGRTLLPVRALIEAVGGTVDWDEDEQKVTIQVKDNMIELWIDRKIARVNGVDKVTDVAPQLINERTMLPLRFIAENLDCDVYWDGRTSSVIITFQP